MNIKESNYKLSKSSRHTRLAIRKKVEKNINENIFNLKKSSLLSGLRQTGEIYRGTRKYYGSPELVKDIAARQENSFKSDITGVGRGLEKFINSPRTREIGLKILKNLGSATIGAALKLPGSSVDPKGRMPSAKIYQPKSFVDVGTKLMSGVGGELSIKNPSLTPPTKPPTASSITPPTTRPLTPEEKEKIEGRKRLGIPDDPNLFKKPGVPLSASDLGNAEDVMVKNLYKKLELKSSLGDLQKDIETLGGVDVRASRKYMIGDPEKAPKFLRGVARVGGALLSRRNKALQAAQVARFKQLSQRASDIKNLDTSYNPRDQVSAARELLKPYELMPE